MTTTILRSMSCGKFWSLIVTAEEFESELTKRNSECSDLFGIICRRNVCNRATDRKTNMR